MNVQEIHARAVEEFDRRIRTVSHEQWGSPTPCTDWDVRALVNHLVNENKWTPPMLEGKTLEDVGDAFDGDLLGDDPQGAWAGAATDATESVQQEGTPERVVHVSFGDIPGSDYISQLICDHVIHTWDLARAIGADDRLDPDLVEFAYQTLAPQAEAWRSAGAFGDVVEVPEGADRQTALLALTGRRA